MRMPMKKLVFELRIGIIVADWSSARKISVMFRPMMWSEASNANFQ